MIAIMRVYKNNDDETGTLVYVGYDYDLDLACETAFSTFASDKGFSVDDAGADYEIKEKDAHASNKILVDYTFQV